MKSYKVLAGFSNTYFTTWYRSPTDAAHLKMRAVKMMVIAKLCPSTGDS